MGQSTLKQDAIVIFGCACCLMQSALSLVLLVTQWVKHPTCILYLKIQLCLAIIVQMCIFLYATKNVINEIFFFLNRLNLKRGLKANHDFFFLEQLRIFLSVLTNSDHSRSNIAFESIAHCLHRDN